MALVSAIHAASREPGLINAVVLRFVMSFEPTTERLVRILLKLAEELGKTRPQGLEIGYYIKHKELAQMIGARREVVSGLLNQLCDHGLVAYGRRGPIRVDSAALRRYLEHLTRQ